MIPFNSTAFAIEQQLAKQWYANNDHFPTDQEFQAAFSALFAGLISTLARLYLYLWLTCLIGITFMGLYKLLQWRLQQHQQPSMTKTTIIDPTHVL